MAPERMTELLHRMCLYLEGPKFTDSLPGRQYVLQKLADKGITDTLTSYNPKGTSWYNISFQWLGWQVNICEETYAVRKSDGVEVFCPPL